jgi:hypothetical protein
MSFILQFRPLFYSTSAPKWPMECAVGRAPETSPMGRWRDGNNGDRLSGGAEAFACRVSSTGGTVETVGGKPCCLIFQSTCMWVLLYLALGQCRCMVVERIGMTGIQRMKAVFTFQLPSRKTANASGVDPPCVARTKSNYVQAADSHSSVPASVGHFMHG